ncbi:MAG: MFS transporter [Labilithrix sp.]|nr:MFS transporter [Labilithrix sp.]
MDVESERPGRTKPNKVYVLFILVVVYTFNFIDRQIIGILAAPIKRDLDLTDTELGLMGGLAFALFYAGLGIPIAYLADRKSRVWIMTIALALWSGFTALCGLAGSFWQLFLCRMGVGIGEAGGVAPAYSLISDYFPPRERGRALAVYSFGIPIGSALGMLFGGFIASEVNWRVAFITVGLAGLVLSFVFKPSVADPPRGQYDPPTATKEAASLAEVVKTLLGKPSFWGLTIGAASGSILGYGLMFWLPSFFVRSYGLSLKQVSLFVGGLLFLGGVLGMWIGGVLADRLGAKSPRFYALVPAVAAALAGPAYGLAITMPSLEVGFFLFLVPQILGLVWLGPVLTSIQHLVAPNMRTTASAFFLFVNNLIGIGVGTVFFGALADRLAPRYGADALRYAMLIGLGFFAISATSYVLASRRLERDWHR